MTTKRILHKRKRALPPSKLEPGIARNNPIGTTHATATHTTKGKLRELPVREARKKNTPFDPNTMCGAQLRRRPPGDFCQLWKGQGTPHEGRGRCHLHGGLTPKRTGLASLLKQGRIKAIIDKIQEDDRPLMDLAPEVELMRAMVVDYINRYDDFITMLETWYDAIDTTRRAQRLPPVPRKYPDLEQASSLLEGISRIVERMHKMQREGSITMDTFRGVMEQMGMAVAAHISDPAILQAIETDWSMALVDPRTLTKTNGRPAYRDDNIEDPDEGYTGG